MADSIIIALITAGFPTLTTAITAVCQSRATKKNAAKQSILQMIMEDHMAIQEKKLPTNYQNVLHEFDIYKKNGGTSVTVGANNTRKAIGASSITTTASQDIYVTRIVGIRY